ncbi:RluA family pseudouridine synthase [Maribacter sp. ACAM166]|uniref:RluA family pseudouridine synthase n=1 Tax=Maribacter sp. ACAM166 TaxID=2508996 RepID=UPI0010FE3E39|nr:RluA family pseudouridine synthase [Maribacter sp. ACAM166]TLP79730.1 RluA family pseudouridine synthase [Maribacter sp. ACAM166]
MQLKEIHIVKNFKEPMRLQEYGVGIFKRIPTKSALKKAIKKELVFVDGIVASTGIFIKGGEKIEYAYQIEDTNSTRLKLNLEVIYEDDYLAVVNKPAGILVSGNGFKTVANALGQNLRSSTAFDSVRPQPVHRLDYATTGLLLVGKTNSSIVALNKLFKEKQILKTYYAVTIGLMTSSGSIDFLIDEKMALSIFQVMDCIPSKRFYFLNLVKLDPQTGRRHQLRKHMFMNGNPILGDAAYFLEGLQLKGKGLYLHAYSLKFVHPVLNKEMYIISNLPKKFEKLFPGNIRNKK